ncbi:hypothetical protein ACFL0W_02855 [Nanoarchaeota archaeon]
MGLEILLEWDKEVLFKDSNEISITVNIDKERIDAPEIDTFKPSYKGKVSSPIAAEHYVAKLIEYAFQSIHDKIKVYDFEVPDSGLPPLNIQVKKPASYDRNIKGLKSLKFEPETLFTIYDHDNLKRALKRLERRRDLLKGIGSDTEYLIVNDCDFQVGVRGVRGGLWVDSKYKSGELAEYVGTKGE